MNIQSEIAVFGGGCFWCTEALFKRLRGVISVKPGYAGGNRPNPTYHQVCTGLTGHAEVIQIEYDPSVITYSDLLEIFWHTHNPTSLNRQGNDEGEQYRSIILYTSEEQQKTAEASKLAAGSSGEFDKPIVTEIKKLEKFYEAEADHFNYFENNSYQPYCQLIIAPKVKHFLAKYSDKVNKK